MANDEHEPEPYEASSHDDPQLTLLDSEREPQHQKNSTRCTVILAKTIIGAGGDTDPSVAALPLTDVLLGWPLALAFLLLVAYATYASLDILVRAIRATSCTSYSGVARTALGLWLSILLEISILVFAIGLMIVYEVAVGDLLVGKKGFEGLLCSSRDDIMCSRALVVGATTAIVLLPAVSFRKLESSAIASWIGMLALCIWALATLILLAASVLKQEVHKMRFTPDRKRLGGSAFAVFANICAIIPVLTTAYSCQAAAPFVMAELRPKTTQQMRKVASGAVATTTALYMLIAIGSYLVFGEAIQSDVLHNFTPQSLVAVVPVWLAELLCVTVRLSFLLGIVTLFPLMMFPARDGLVRLLSRRDEPLSTGAFFMVTYGITFGVYLVSVVTPSIWGPIQIIGATAGAVIGFLIPGLLAFKNFGRVLDGEECSNQFPSLAIEDSWNLSSPVGWLLIFMAVVQSITGVASQLLKAA